MYPNIKKTFLRKLFESPKPIDSKLFLSLHSVMFPGKHNFIKFLTEKNYEKVVDYAKKILLRLSYEMNFSPPTRLLLNILDFETQLSSDRKREFIGRDHFVHLVHLYLLGIYILFYHKGINNRLIQHFSIIKRKWNQSFIGEAACAFPPNPASDIIYAWKLFVLSHDLAYPWEIVSCREEGEIDLTKDKISSFFRIYGNLNKGFFTDLCLRIISRLIVLRQLLKGISDNNFQTVDLPYIEGWYEKDVNGKSLKPLPEADIAIIKENWSNAINIQRIKGNATSRVICDFLPYKSIGACLKREDDDIPVAMVLPNKEGDHDFKSYYFFEINKWPKIITSRLPIYAFNEFESPIKNHYWSYYVVSPDLEFNNILTNLLGDKISSFNDVAMLLFEKIPFQLSFITNDDECSELSFQIYALLYDALDFLKIDDEALKLEVFFDAAEKTFMTFEGKFVEKISEVIKEAIKRVVTNTKVLRLFRDTRNIDDTVTTILNVVFNLKDDNELPSIDKLPKHINIKEFSKYISSKIGDELDKEIRAKVKINDTYTIIKELMVKKFVYESIFSGKALPYELDYDKIPNLENKNKLEERFKKGIGSAKDAYEYRPEYIFKQYGECKKYYDHGVMSGLILLDIQNVFNMVSQYVYRGADDFLNKLISIGIINGSNKNNTLLFDCDDICIETIYTIMIHNIYPKELKDTTKRKYRTNLFKDPFSYLAILSDSLQQWDRNRIINQAYMNLPYGTYGDGFDIEIKDNLLYITELGVSLNLSNRSEELKSNLNSILQNGGQLVKLKLAEWK